MSRRSFAALTVVLLSNAVSISLAAPAPAPVTLDQIIGSVEQSPRLVIARSQAEEGKWRTVESYGGLLPHVDASATHLLGEKFVLTDIAFGGNPVPVSIPAILPTTTYSITANWTLFDGLANIDRWRSVSRLQEAGNKEYDWARFQSTRETTLLFYRAVAAQGLREVAEQNMKTLEDHLQDARVLKSAGAGTKFDVLRVEVQVSEARSEMLNAEDGVQVTLLRLGEAVGQDFTGRTVSGKLPALTPELARDLKLDDAARSDLSALAAREEGLSEAQSAASRHWVPKVGLFGQVQWYNNRNDEMFSSDPFRNAYSYGVQVSWNLFNGLTDHAHAQVAAEQRFRAEKALDQGRIKAKADFESSRRRYIYFCSVARSRAGDVEKSNESVRLAREGRRVGTRTNTDLLDAELELFRARAGLVNAELGAVEALLNLELALGRSLYRFE